MKRFFLIITIAFTVLLPHGTALAALNKDKVHVTGDYPWQDDTDAVKACEEAVGPGGTAPSGAINKETIWNAFITYTNLKTYQIAGIMGNIQYESSFDPTILQKGGNSLNPADAGSGGFGLVQWTPGSKLIPYLHAPLNQANAISSEVQAFWMQLNGLPPADPSKASSEKPAGDAIKAAPDVRSAAIAMEVKYERHADPKIQVKNGIQVRPAAAEAILAEAKAKNWLKANDPEANLPTPIGGSGGEATGSTPDCKSATGVTTTDGCTNPFAAGHFELHRTDDGVDYAAKGSNQPLLAICDMTILNVTNAEGWGPGSSFIYAKLTSGPFTGKCWYYAEHLDKGDWPKVGAKLKAGDHVATLVPGGWDLEVGFARGDHLAATSVGSNNYPSVSGIAAAKFLRSLGAQTRDNPGPPPAVYGGGSCP